VAGITASTSTALGVGSVELGHATDTTIARVSAGVVSIEGVNVVTTSSTDTLTNKAFSSYTETVNALGTLSGTATSTLSLGSGTIFTATVTGARTFKLPVVSAGASITLAVTIGSGGSIVAIQDSNAATTLIKWVTTPTYTTTTNKMDAFAFWSDGTNWYGSIIGQAYSV
jgi:hypothetical protein